ncbi:asparagine--tRNA ligase [uncultured Helcococcus sp.]|uniref:asparagine--tRNA ligase n=1 Tax=uncultured Helcococcus sp. TaxID=1072508 RepID=UPI00261C2611|nr:asparagine--tRNA ligase [uncultured Helcococcus sp.]
MEIKDLFKSYKNFVGQEIEIHGWIKKSRQSKNIGFLEINDGTFFNNVQVVVDSSLDNFNEIFHLGLYSAIKVKGILVEPENAKQDFEVQAKEVNILNESSSDYPLQNKRQTFEYLRTMPSLRSRTNAFNAVFRVRSELAFAIHKFFNERGFVYIHTPIITASDAEGAGEMFRVTNLDLNDLPKDEQGKVDLTKDFFGSESNLTVSGQLEVESFAMTYSKVYTFGPTFRAENSNTPRHAAEFWMIEPEIAFAELPQVMDLAEDMVKYIINHVLETLPEEMNLFNQFVEKGIIDKLTNIVKSDFKRITYTEAIDILEKSDKKFEYPVEWGVDLQTEHERYLSEEVFNGPVFVTDYPKDIKSFYMKLNDDKKTVAAMDLLVPGVGELIGGSERENDSETLEMLMEEKGINKEDYQWYTNLRRFGGVAHGGYGLGFERMVMYMTGMKNIRDVIPYPRTVGSMKKHK